MNGSTTGMNATQSKQDHAGSDAPLSKDCCSDGPARITLWTPPPSEAHLPPIINQPQHQTIPPGTLDPLSLRIQCPLTYPDYFQDQPGPYHLLTGSAGDVTLHVPGFLSPVPGQADSSHHNLFSAPWVTEPVLCTMMPGDLNSTLVSICPPQTMGRQEVQEGLTEVTSHITQPVNMKRKHFRPALMYCCFTSKGKIWDGGTRIVVCNMSGGGQVVLVNHCEPGPVFLTLESAPTHRDNGPAPGVSVLGAQSQPPLHDETTFPQYESRGQKTNMQPHLLPARDFGAMCESKSRKPCRCTRSQCLKLYCECFATGVMCSNCDCSNCHNNVEHEVKRHKAIQSCLGRNPDAFRPKIAGGKSGDVKGWHNRGCNCKRSNCLKNYCECYEANIMCTSSCKCVGCRNYDCGSESSLREKTVKNRWPVSVICPAVVGAVCGCLLAQAEEAERGNLSPIQAELMVLEEFGHCVSQISEAMFKSSPQ